MAQTSQFVDILKNIKCNNSLFRNPYGTLITISSDCTVAQAFIKLVENRIQSAPVIDVKTNKPLFMITMLHLMRYYISSYSMQDFQNILGKIFSDDASYLSKTPICELAPKNMLSYDPVFVVKDTDSLFDVLQLMSQWRCHRVMVTDAHNNLVNVITQSKIAQLLPNLLPFNPKANKSIRDTNLGFKSLTTVSFDITAYEAFKLMTEKRISGLPILDKDGNLFGTISVSDFKLCGYESDFWTLLQLPVSEYLREVALSAGKEIRQWQGQPRPSAAITISPEEPLEMAIRKFNFYKIHRVYIVESEDNKKPTGVISLHDAIAELIAM